MKVMSDRGYAESKARGAYRDETVLIKKRVHVNNCRKRFIKTMKSHNN